MTEGTSLYQLVLARLELADVLVDAQSPSDDLARAMHDRINRLRRAATHDLSLTSRQVDELLADIEAGLLTPRDD